MSDPRLLGSGMAAQAGNALAARPGQMSSAIAAQTGGMTPPPPQGAQMPPPGNGQFFKPMQRDAATRLRQQQALAQLLRRRDAEFAAQGMPPATAASQPLP